MAGRNWKLVKVEPGPAGQGRRSVGDEGLHAAKRGIDAGSPAATKSAINHVVPGNSRDEGARSRAG